MNGKGTMEQRKATLKREREKMYKTRETKVFHKIVTRLSSFRIEKEEQKKRQREKEKRENERTRENKETRREG